MINSNMPIFLHFINRELYRGYSITPDFSRIYNYIEALSLSQCVKIVCNVAQIHEFLQQAAPVVELLKCLRECNFLQTLSQVQSNEEFIESRQKLYFFDKERYPMYFDEYSKIQNLPLSLQTTKDTTIGLQKRILDLREDDLFTLTLVTPDQLEKFSHLLPKIQQAIIRRDGKAITSSLVVKAIEPNNRTDQMMIARYISMEYINHYADSLKATVPSGLPEIKLTQIESGFPLIDIEIILHLLKTLGFYTQKFRKDKSYNSNIANYLLSHNHVLFCETTSKLINISFNDFKFTYATQNLNFSLEPDREIFRTHIKKTMSLYIKNQISSKNLDEFFIQSTLILSDIISKLNFSPKQALFNLTPPKQESEMKNILLQIATQTEQKAVSSIFRQEFSYDGTIEAGNIYLDKYSFDGIEIYVSRTSIGVSGEASLDSVLPDVIRQLNIDGIISSGICYGLNESAQKIGDVVICNNICDAESGKIEDRVFDARGEIVSVDPKLLSIARNISTMPGEELNYNAYDGTYLWGLKVVSDLQYRELVLKKFPTAKAGDMESYLLSKISRRYKVSLLVVKSICDWAYKKEDIDQQAAANNSADFCCKVIKSLSRVAK